MALKVKLENQDVDTSKVDIPLFATGVGEMAGWKAHESIDESRKILTMFMKEKKTFAIEYKDNHKVIGSLGIEVDRLKDDPEYQSLYGREIGYVLNKDYWGAGLMPEAVQCVIQYLSLIHI